jgi:hypothetical protein
VANQLCLWPTFRLAGPRDLGTVKSDHGELEFFRGRQARRRVNRRSEECPAVNWSNRQSQPILNQVTSNTSCGPLDRSVKKPLPRRVEIRRRRVVHEQTDTPRRSSKTGHHRSLLVAKDHYLGGITHNRGDRNRIGVGLSECRTWWSRQADPAMPS